MAVLWWLTTLSYDDGKLAITVGIGCGGRVDGTLEKTTGGVDGLGVTYGDGEKPANEATAGVLISPVGMVATEVDGSEVTDEAGTITKVVPEIVITETPLGTDDDLTTTGLDGNELAGGNGKL